MALASLSLIQAAKRRAAACSSAIPSGLQGVHLITKGQVYKHSNLERNNYVMGVSIVTLYQEVHVDSLECFSSCVPRP